MNLLFSNDRRGQYPPSYYAATATPHDIAPELRGEVRADVCVIGGGYTGLSAALHLAEKGLDVVLLEAHRVGFGASGRNGGQVGSGQRLEQTALEKSVGKDDARKLWDIAEEAKALVREIAAKHAPDAHYKPGVAHAVWSAAELSHEAATAEALARDYGYDQITMLDRDEVAHLTGSKGFGGGSLDMGAGHVHPLNLAIGLAQAATKAGARIFENSVVHHIQPGAKVTVQTDKGRVLADHVVLAANGYIGGLDRTVAARVMPINNFIIATEPLGDRWKEILPTDVAVADSKFVVNYWRRSEDGRLLFGGGESYGYRFPTDIAALVRKPMLSIYPQLADARIDYAWGGTLAITTTRMPHFAQPRPGLWSASGFSGHGVALATMAGKIMAEAIAGDAGRFDLMASLKKPPFPGGPALRSPLLMLAMTWFSLRDRLGI
ncbi:MAG: FAD-binding oxidoreductase [Paracoccaceae bacterium]